MRRHFFFLSLFLLAFQCRASFKVYGVGKLEVMPREGTEKFTKLEKYGGGIGLEYSLFSFMSLGSELDYVRGVGSDPIPHKLSEKVSADSYGGTREKGVGFVNVHYFELWLRPKFIIPIPLIKPYLVLPLSLLNYGGMQGYSVFGVGLGALAGIDLSLGSFSLFAESGVVLRARKGVSDINKGPPWGMFDFSIPINFGVGYSF